MFKRAPHQSDVGLLLGDTAYYIHGDTGNLTRTSVQAGSAIHEAEYSFLEQWEKGRDGFHLRFGFDNSAISVERRSITLIRNPIAKLSERKKMRELLNLGGTDASMAYSQPVASPREGVSGFVAIESKGHLYQLRKQAQDRGASIGGGWPWFAISAAMGQIAFNSSPRVAIVTFADTFCSFTYVVRGGLLVYETHFYSDPHERSIAWSTMLEDVAKYESSGKGKGEDQAPLSVLLVSPHVAWAEREVDVWPQLQERPGVSIASAKQIAEAVLTLRPQASENILYASTDDIIKYGVYAAQAAVLVMVALMAVSVYQAFGAQSDTAKQLPMYARQTENASRLRREAEDRRDEIARLEAGILSPSSNDAAGAALLMQSVEKAIPENMLVLEMRVERKEWRLEAMWQPLRKLKNETVTEEDQARAQVATQFLANLKSMGFTGERVQGADAAIRARVPGAMLFIGRMP